MTGTFIRSGQTLHRNAGPDVLATLPGEGRLHVLSGPAAVIWHVLGDAATIAEVTDEVARVYERPAAEVRSSVEGCVRTLTRRGLVEERS
jgi:Coenzyme PQQ synthesis protein D (PqqD)